MKTILISMALVLLSMLTLSAQVSCETPVGPSFSCPTGTTCEATSYALGQTASQMKIIYPSGTGTDLFTYSDGLTHTESVQLSSGTWTIGVRRQCPGTGKTPWFVLNFVVP